MTDRMRGKLALMTDGVVDIVRADATLFPEKGTKADLHPLHVIQKAAAGYKVRAHIPYSSLYLASNESHGTTGTEFTKMVLTPHNK